MIWLQNLYWGEKAREKGKALIRAAERGRKSRVDSCWLISLSVYPEGQLDLFSVSDLRSRLFDPSSMVIIGAAGNKKEALSLLERMAADCLKAEGNLNLKRCFAHLPAGSWRGVSL